MFFWGMRDFDINLIYCNDYHTATRASVYQDCTVTSAYCKKVLLEQSEER
jgi:hypothetical protein